MRSMKTKRERSSSSSSSPSTASWRPAATSRPTAFCAPSDLASPATMRMKTFSREAWTTANSTTPRRSRALSWAALDLDMSG